MSDDSISQRAAAILSRVPLIDGHNDWPHLIRSCYHNELDDARFDPSVSHVGHVDIGRLVKGGSGGIFLSAYVDCPTKENDFSDDAHYEPMRDTLQQIDLIYRLIERYDDVLELVGKADDILPTFRSGKIACLIGVEGLHQIGNSASVLRLYHRLGVRYVTLTHNQSNLYAESSTSKDSPHSGLTRAGIDMVREMNRIGMMIDLSHTSDATATAVLETSIAPVAFTHSLSYELHDHPRNVPDKILPLLKENQGIIMVTFVAKFLAAKPEEATVSTVVDNILHIANQIGFDHLGIGSDYDGTQQLPKGLEDVSKFGALVEELLRRDVKETDIEKILGLNVIRVLRGVEDVASKNRHRLPVLEDVVKPLWDEERTAHVRSLFPNAA